MSIVNVRAALETAFEAITPTLDIAWENVPFIPVHDTPYQEVRLLPAEPENPVYGGDFKREIGILQIMLFYPQLPTSGGPSEAATRAELIRSTFFRGSTWSASGVSVIIQRTPEIAPAFTEGDWYVLPVRVRYFANVY